MRSTTMFAACSLFSDGQDAQDSIRSGYRSSSLQSTSTACGAKARMSEAGFQRRVSKFAKSPTFRVGRDGMVERESETKSNCGSIVKDLNTASLNSGNCCRWGWLSSCFNAWRTRGMRPEARATLTISLVSSDQQRWVKSMAPAAAAAAPLRAALMDCGANVMAFYLRL